MTDCIQLPQSIWVNASFLLNFLFFDAEFSQIKNNSQNLDY